MTDDTTATRAEGVNRDRRKRQRSLKLFLRDILIIFVVAVLVSFLIKTFLIRSFYIPSGSMENTLQINDRIVVNELEPNLVPISHGDVVVFRDPGGWLPPKVTTPQNPLAAAVDWALSVVGLSASDSDDHLIKRVIGLPGDHVTCCNTLGQLSVNGVPIKEPYILLPAGETNASHPFDVVVPKGDLWVLGDNRWRSQDSSLNQGLPGKGFVPITDVVGRAVLISWPVSRWSVLDDYPGVFAGVGETKK
ncbi:signal peptidase I [Leifsonia sp. Root112D2]|uniref:signal peptidase I n=1 Tax=Leifsonia sp. Root112D2 TaxID=1736426 RepID=UPI0006F6D613|nr:signal peptidase I [Leifsonia sp. Root112D2]KQV07710.1 S26 family signal peptidase [Leifsonia sp. Root112D2]